MRMFFSVTHMYKTNKQTNKQTNKKKEKNGCIRGLVYVCLSEHRPERLLDLLQRNTANVS